MVGLPDFTVLQQRMDFIVDGRLAELVELHPWTNQGYGAGGGPDPNRNILFGPQVVGIYVKVGATVTGEISQGFAGSNTALLEQKVWLSIQATILGPLTYWKAMDRVYFPQRGEWFNITRVGPSATFRHDIYLDRLQGVDLQATLMLAKKIVQKKPRHPMAARLQAFP